MLYDEEQHKIVIPPFKEGVSCKKCRGAILLAPYHHKWDWDERTQSYSERTTWVCYMCGKQHTESELEGGSK